MSEQNRELVRRYSDEFWGRGNAELADQLFAPDFVDHTPAAPGLPPGPEGQRVVVRVFRGAFPDLRVSTEDIIVEGDKAVLRWTARGTHEGELMGIAATGKEITLAGIDVLRIADGKIAERWAQGDNLGMLQQLGVVPELAPTQTQA
jgi:steroid delta-isomerase-like uncharacterized protein